ncbi:MAG: methylase domain protein, partial [Caulobacteraceae bacterium]|nr:methylase domain protein [Caulobacteraceae bacterium]
MARRGKGRIETGVGRELRAKSRARRETLSVRAEAVRNERPARNNLLPELQLVTRAIASLKPATRRLRKLDPAQVARVRRAIAELGFCSPVLITADGEVLDGHTRVEAALQLGLAEAPCLVVDHLNCDELRVLRIALNRLPETGVWDFGALKLEFAELIALDAPIEVSGFSLPEIDQLVLEDELPPYETGPLEPDPELPPVCHPGDLWALDEHLIACGDARDPATYETLFQSGEAAQLVFTDVPYNVPIAGHVTGGKHREFAMASGEMSRKNFEAFNLRWMTLAFTHLRNGGLLATYIDWRSVELIIAVGRVIGLSLLNVVVWAKTNGGMGSLWRSQHELLPVLKKGKAPHRNNVSLGKHGRWRSNVWNYPGASTMGSDSRTGLKLHPTVKPVAMLEDAL